MKKLISLLAALMFLPLAAQELSVMSFNIRLALDSDGENAWAHRRPDVLELLNYYEPDVLGVQEALPVQMRHLRDGLKNHSAIGVGRDDGADAGEYSAIFYNHRKFRMMASGTFWLSETPDKPSKGWDAAYNRVCSYVLLKDKKSGKKFWAFNLHLDHVGNVAREESARLVLQKIQALNTKNHPVILTGDFNLTDDTPPIKLLSENLKDTYRHCAKPPYGPSGTFTAFNTQKPAKERIDYIFTKGFGCKSHRIINDRRENLLYPSDHFPVFATLKFE
ncbi:endonuclease/exonuclease/phosphatase [Chryseobacterium sp. 6424]|uniref:endonuclease/exonuclease/phosphatase family protein n=1 Tax=Chryseobacterium sp. 6424 TaxID=2039166 RepID=UPI000EFDACB5|nr:endonuclease/exonuclease/phosphatase family protein [Chryseobacterium sp. 6424]AYO58514.1 endonuclease/exonuclease/phosphatase [Chryseobacterium sp. 6424]